MFKLIVPKIVLKELEKIDKNNQQLIFNEIIYGLGLSSK